MLNLIWDLDGTVINSEEEVKIALLKSLEENGFYESDAIKPLRIGPTIDVILRTSFSQETMSDKQLAAVVKSFRKNYDNSDFANTPAFPGIAEIIHDTKNFTHYVITNKPDLPSTKILAKLGFTAAIKRLITPYTFGTEKKLSKPELFERLIQEENLDKQKTYGIGDMQTDEIAAHAAGIKAIGVLWGTGTHEELAACDFVCQTVSDLHSLLTKLDMKK